ncbi:dihydrodipicolinate synthase family protein [Rathayibacter sp. CAU 1779]
MTEHLLDGVTVPIVTAMTAPGVADAAAADAHLVELARAGVDNLMVLGSNGEGPLIMPEAGADFVAGVTRRWHESRQGGRVLVNVSAPGTAEVRRRARIAADAGADVLIVSPPGYFRHRDDEIVAHIRAVEEFGLPYAIYNIPKYSIPLTAGAFRTLLETADGLVGLKDSSGSMETLREFLELSASRPDIALIQGDEARLVEGLLAGAGGIVPGIGNVAPALCVAVQRERSEEAQRIIAQLVGVHAIRPGVPTIKWILSDRGWMPSACAEPLAPISAAEAADLAAFLEPFEEHLIPRRAGSPDPL